MKGMRERVLVVDDEIGMRAALEATLRRTEWQVESAAGVADALRKFESGRHSLVITDMRMPDGDGLEVMRRVRQLAPATAVILLTAYGSIPQAVEAMKAGACDYLIKPVSYEHLHETVARLMTKSSASKQGTQLLGNSPALLRTLEHARMAARTSADVLIEAESGTGKELLARYIHQQSRHAAGPFVAVNCAAVPETLLESELFGHARGAFTGAITSKKGKFELAHGGTLLLDEIGEMPLALQPKLLRVLQERKLERLGEAVSVPFETRVIATTNRNLSDRVHDGGFRADLYFRLNVIPLTLPPLRERSGDVALLARHFARAASDGCSFVELSPEFLEGLQEHTWPGNVRELANTVQRAIAFSGGASVIGPEFLEFTMTDTQCRIVPMQMGVTRHDADRYLFESTLAKMHGNRTRTAEVLGVSLRTVRNKIRSYGLAERASA
jgi:DNA-binding NtrC family response regulator